MVPSRQAMEARVEIVKIEPQLSRQYGNGGSCSTYICEVWLLSEQTFGGHAGLGRTHESWLEDYVSSREEDERTAEGPTCGGRSEDVQRYWWH